VPGLPDAAAREGLTPLAYMRRYGAFEIRKKTGAMHETEVAAEELDDVRVDRFRRVFTRTAKPASPNIVPVPTPDVDEDGRRMVGVEVDGEILRGFQTPSGRLEFYSHTLADWGWPAWALPTY